MLFTRFLSLSEQFNVTLLRVYQRKVAHQVSTANLAQQGHVQLEPWDICSNDDSVQKDESESECYRV